MNNSKISILIPNYQIQIDVEYERWANIKQQKRKRKKNRSHTINTSPLLTIASGLQRSFLSNVVYLFFWDLELMPKHLTKNIMQIIIKKILKKIPMKAEFKVYILGGSNHQCPCNFIPSCPCSKTVDLNSINPWV